MGQDIVDGNLPYTNLWDIKPPLAYIPYSIFIFLFGKNIIAIRLLGLICVFISSCITWKICNKYWNKRTAFISSSLLIIFASTLPSGQSTMTEHLALIPQSLILFILIRNRFDFSSLFVLGLLLGCSVLIRTNLVYLTIPVTYFIISNEFIKHYRKNLKNCIIFYFGLSIPFSLVILVYFFDNNLEVLYKSSIKAPFYYSSYESRSFYNIVINSYYITRNNLLSVNFLIWILAILGIIISYFKINQDRLQRISNISILLLIFVLLSIFHTGRDFGHYMIQLLPYSVLLSSFTINFVISNENRILKTLFITCILTLAFLPITKIIKQYHKIYIIKKFNNSLYYGTTYNILKYFKENDVSGEYLFFMSHHICYWFLDSKIPTKYVTPSTLAKDFLITAIDGSNSSSEIELTKILDKKPKYIIKRKSEWYLKKFNKNKSIDILKYEIEKNYKLVKIIDSVFIYQKM